MSSNQKIDYLKEINEKGVNNIINVYETQNPKENFFELILIQIENYGILHLHTLRYDLSKFFKTYGGAIIFRRDELQITIDREFSMDHFLYLLEHDKKNNFYILNLWKKAIIDTNIMSERKYRDNMSFFDKFDMMIFGLYVSLTFYFKHSEKEKYSITELNTKKAYHNYVSSNFNSDDKYGFYIHRAVYLSLVKSKDLEFDIKQIVEIFTDEGNNQKFVVNHISPSSLCCKDVSSTEEIQNGFKIFKDDTNRIPFVIFKKGSDFFILDLANNNSKIIEDKSKKRLILDKLVVGESNIISCDNKIYQFNIDLI